MSLDETILKWKSATHMQARDLIDYDSFSEIDVSLSTQLLKFRDFYCKKKSMQLLRIPAANSVTFDRNNHNKPLKDTDGTTNTSLTVQVNTVIRKYLG